jgi:AcrR family transcriptional regulator
MGNFYTNIVLREKDGDAVARSMAEMSRRAYVSRTTLGTIVFDEQCDNRDLEELERLARELSRRHGPALAVCNHDDDVLWYALADGGRVLDRYNSFPALFDEGTDEPTGGDGTRLCASFGASERTAEVDALLRQPHSDYGLEVDRHAELCRLVDLPMESVGMGYGYVSRGEFSNAGGATLFAVGGAPALDADGPPPKRPSSASYGPPPELANAPAGQLAFAIFAMVRSDVDVPASLAHVLGHGRVNAMLVLERLKRYVVKNRLLVTGTPPAIRGDAFIEEALGIRDLPFAELTRVFCERFKVQPLTAEERAALDSHDPTFARETAEAMARVLEQLQQETRS